MENTETMSKNKIEKDLDNKKKMNRERSTKLMHGGDIYRNQIAIDFSVNTNPLGMPQIVKDAAILAVSQSECYPDPLSQKLREQIALIRKVQPDQVLCGNGASEIFMGIVRALQPKKALVMAPTFSGYEYALHAVKADIHYVELVEQNHYSVTESVLEQITSDIDMMFLCNPNNPTGQLVEKSLLEKIINKCQEQNIYLVVDQCFLELTGRYEEFGVEDMLIKDDKQETEGNSSKFGTQMEEDVLSKDDSQKEKDKLSRNERQKVEDRVSNCNKLMIVNAFTKTYAMAGLRLGYLIAEKELCQQIQKHLPEWNVSIPANAAGLAACKERSYVEDSVESIRRERGYLYDNLTQMGITCYPSDANYILLKSELPLYEALKECGVLIRHCDNYHGLTVNHYRIAVKSHDENEQLLQIIGKLCNQKFIEDKVERNTEKANRENSNERLYMNPENEISKKTNILLETDYVDKIKYERINKSDGILREEIQEIPPLAIEAQSFDTITKELEALDIEVSEEHASILKRVIHTTADFEYVNTLTISANAVERAKNALQQGTTIITDTNMALSGIHKKTLEKLGGKAVCFMADSEVARIAKERGVTRATVSMEFASRIDGPCIFAIGNAPTALLQLYDMIKAGQIHPELIIGVPVGFVNVVASKELIMEMDVPYIINRGRKGGSNVAAAICNALLYQIDNER